MVTSFGTFLVVSIVVIVTPGQDTALTIRNTLVGGRSGGILTAAGVSTGQAVWAIATSAGLAAVLTASEAAFTAVKVVGAAYLVVLGAQTLLAALRRTTDTAPIVAKRRSLSRTRALRQGIASNLGNPKMAVFFTSLLPQFARGPSFANLLGLGLVFCFLTLVWLTTYAVVVSRAKALFDRPRFRSFVDAVTGGALVALGLRLAAERR